MTSRGQAEDELLGWPAYGLQCCQVAVFKKLHRVKQGFYECVAKGHCKGEDSGGECAPYTAQSCRNHHAFSNLTLII